ncbi:MAG: SRPBCC domain-containing protein [Candidatus Saccharimonadales bacterium]
MNKTNFTILEDKKTLRMERTFPASQHKLWQAYADPNKLAHWFAPKGWSTEVKAHSFSEGGEYVYVMKCEDKSQGEWYGKTSAGKMAFSKINPEISFMYTDYFTDDKGKVNEELPSSHTVVTLEPIGDDSTKLVVDTYYETKEDLKTVLEMGMEDGYSQTLDKLEELLSKDS